jgi:hypothetical protein
VSPNISGDTVAHPIIILIMKKRFYLFCLSDSRLSLFAAVAAKKTKPTNIV